MLIKSFINKIHNFFRYILNYKSWMKFYVNNTEQLCYAK